MLKTEHIKVFTWLKTYINTLYNYLLCLICILLHKYHIYIYIHLYLISNYKTNINFHLSSSYSSNNSFYDFLDNCMYNPTYSFVRLCNENKEYLLSSWWIQVPGQVIFVNKRTKRVLRELLREYLLLLYKEIPLTMVIPNIRIRYLSEKLSSKSYKPI